MLRLILLSLALAGLVGHAFLFNFVTDDAYISFRYARNLAEHGELVFNPGERVEGYTNFLWTVTLAGLMKAGIQPEIGSRVLGVLFAGFCLLLVFRIGHLLHDKPSAWDAVAPMLLAANSSYAAWSMGGLETQMFTALFLAGTLLFLKEHLASRSQAYSLSTQHSGIPHSCDTSSPRDLSSQPPASSLTSTMEESTNIRTPESTSEGDASQGIPPRPSIPRRNSVALWLASGFLCGLAVLTRPEGLLFFGLLVLFRFLANIRWERRLRPRWDEVAWVVAFVIVVGSHLLWRLSYYGWPLPNTFYIKSATGPGTASRGIYYVWSFIRDSSSWLVPILCLIGWPRKAGKGPRTIMLLTALLIIPFTAYVIRVGGDFMGLSRFFVPLLPFLALTTQEALREIASRMAPRVGSVIPIGVTVAVIGMAAASWVEGSMRQIRATGADRGIDSIGYLKKFAEDRALVGKWFGSVVREDDVMTVGGAGAQPYYARIPTVDAFGLTNAYIAHYVPAVSDRPGHQKFACNEFLVMNRPCPGTRPNTPPPPPRPKPTILCHTYRLGDYAPYTPPPGEAAYWRSLGYEWVSAKIPGLEPPYYSFLKRIDRQLGPFPAQGDRLP